MTLVKRYSGKDCNGTEIVKNIFKGRDYYRVGRHSFENLNEAEEYVQACFNSGY